MALAALLLSFARAGAAGQNPDYLIGAKDVLAINVWNEPNLSGKFTVEADGSFTFPLIGRIKAAGFTLREFEADLKKRLGEGYLKRPQVSVAVEENRSQMVFVIGEVRQAGTYALTGHMTLIEALARAGSTTTSAGSEAIIVRASPGKTAQGPVLPDQAKDAEVIKVRLERLQEGGVSENVLLRDGDTIFIPRAEMFYISGQVRTPGAYVLQTKDTTVLQALSLAGGATDRAANNRISIVRLVDGKKKETRVKLTDLVQPGDTIIVPERFI
jgi:polysaccharide export outer membrane protein